MKESTVNAGWRKREPHDQTAHAPLQPTPQAFVSVLLKDTTPFLDESCCSV